MLMDLTELSSAAVLVGTLIVKLDRLNAISFITQYQLTIKASAKMHLKMLFAAYIC